MNKDRNKDTKETPCCLFRIHSDNMNTKKKKNKVIKKEFLFFSAI